MKRNIYISILVSIILTFLIVIFFHMLGGFYRGHDSLFNLLRLDGIMENINIGQYSYINHLYHYSFGYAQPIFYTDILIYPIIYLIQIFTDNSIVVYECLVILFWFLTYPIASFSYYKIRNNIWEAQIFALLYTFCNYHFQNLFIRSALSEYIAMVFLPLIILAVFRIYDGLKNNENGKEYIWFIITLVILTFIHGLTLSMIFYFYLFFIIVFFLKFKTKRKYLFKNLVISSVIALLMMSLYILPVIEQLGINKYYFQLASNSVEGYTIAEFIHQLFTLNGEFNILLLLMGIIIVGVLINKKSKNLNFKILSALYFLLLLMLWVGIPLFFIPLLNSVQFKFRFLSYIYLIGSFLVVYSVRYIECRKIYLYTLTIIAIFFSVNATLSYKISASDRFLQTMTYEDYKDEIGRGKEYLPENTTVAKVKEFNEVNTQTTYRDGVYDVTVFDNSYKQYELPIIYYKGYEATNGVLISQSENDFIEVTVPDGVLNFEIQYKQTNVQKIAVLIFIIGVILFIVYEMKLRSFFKMNRKE